MRTLISTKRDIYFFFARFCASVVFLGVLKIVYHLHYAEIISQYPTGCKMNEYGVVYLFNMRIDVSDPIYYNHINEETRRERLPVKLEL